MEWLLSAPPPRGPASMPCKGSPVCVDSVHHDSKWHTAGSAGFAAACSDGRTPPVAPSRSDRLGDWHPRRGEVGGAPPPAVPAGQGP